MRKLWVVVLVVVVSLAVAMPALADPGKPDFSPHIYADGVAWGTKVVTVLPAPNGNNEHSFDKLFVVTNGVEGQLLVAEAAPGRGYNGGRWVTYTATWVGEFEPVLLTSYEEVKAHMMAGHLDVHKGPPDAPGAPPAYFACPLLPVK